MCLIVKKIRHLNHKAKIAKKSILCYKILCFNGGRLYTPVISEDVSMYVQSRILEADDFKQFTCDTRIDHGIHTFSNIQAANYYIRDVLRFRRCCIFPVIIPKGTHYWIGQDNQYVSERIEFL